MEQEEEEEYAAVVVLLSMAGDRFGAVEFDVVVELEIVDSPLDFSPLTVGVSTGGPTVSDVVVGVAVSENSMCQRSNITTVDSDNF